MRYAFTGMTNEFGWRAKESLWSTSIPRWWMWSRRRSSAGEARVIKQKQIPRSPPPQPAQNQRRLGTRAPGRLRDDSRQLHAGMPMEEPHPTFWAARLRFKARAVLAPGRSKARRVRHPKPQGRADSSSRETVARGKRRAALLGMTAQLCVASHRVREPRE